ncbi:MULTISPECIES: YhdP family protein [unclassified Agarivorans]|uniref:YhdP family protein n=1 Tax=unclassified Agarivorans TaxID=2636026 RepID=UPI003D7DAE55
MLKAFSRSARQCWHGLALLLVIVAVCLSLARGILAFASHYKDDIAAWLIKGQDASLSIGQLNARLHNFRPMLVFENSQIAIGKDRDTQFHVDALMLELDLWQTLEQRKVVFKDLVLDGLSFQLDVAPSESEETIDYSHSYQAIADTFLEQLTRFSLTNSIILLNFPEHQLKLDIANLDWLNSNGLHQGDGEVRIGQGLESGRVKFRVDLSGDASQIKQLSGHFFAEAEHLNVNTIPLLSGKVSSQLSSDLNLSLWGDFGAKQQQRWVMQWQPSSVFWGAEELQQLHINGGLLQALQVGQQWRVDKLPWVLNMNGQPNSDFDLQAVVSQQRQLWQIQHLDLAAWSGAIDWLAADKQDIAWSKLLQAGTLEQLKLEYLPLSKRWQYQAQLSDLSAQGQSFIPSFEQLNVHLAGDEQRAQVHFKQQGKFGLAVQFSETFEIEAFDSVVNIDFADSALRLSSAYTQLRTPELDLLAQWSLQWPKQGQWPLLSLIANAEVKDAAKAYRYYPKIMPGKVFDYLKPALLAGQAKHSQVLWYGQLNHYPYQQHDGIFQAFVPLKDARFKFDPHWPNLEKLQLDLLFQNDGLFMESNQALLGAVPAQRITASIPEFHHDSELFITGDIKAPAKAVADYLMQSPVTALSSSLQQLPLSNGDVAGQVYLHIPLSGGEVEVNGHVDFLGNNLAIIPTGMKLNQLKGRLSFQNEKLHSNKLSAIWRGMPLDVKLKTEAQAAHYQLDFDLAGRWKINAAERAFGLPLSEYATGDLAWQGDLNIQLKPQGLFDYRGDFRSELLGLASRLPAPLGKTKTQLWPTALSVSGNNQASDIRLESNQLVSAELTLSYQNEQKKITHGLLNLGANNDLLWQGNGLAMSFDFAELELQPWLKWMKQQANFVPQEKLSDFRNVSFERPPLMFIRGKVQQAHLLEQDLDNFDFAYLPLSKTQLQISSDQLLASIAAPSQPSLEMPVQVKIEKAILPNLKFSLEPDNRASESADSESLFAPEPVSLLQRLPPFVLECDACQFADYRLGKLKLDMPIVDHRLENGRLWIDWGHSQLTSALFWTESEHGEQAGVAGTLNSDSMEQMIETMGITSPLKRTPANFSFDLSWQDALYRPQKGSLDGKLSMKTGSGALTEMSDKGTRLLTLASLDTIRRRLKLDFSDVFEKGLHFDSMSGSINLKHGVADNQDFYLDGVAGTMRGKGKVDFGDGKVDYLVSYSPKVTSSLPVLAAFLVTPVTGVAVLALSKLLEPVVEVVTQIDFALKGNIRQPELIELERVKQKIEVPDEFRKENAR